ncbi:MAG: ASKHA domain-containing protein [Blautia faecis]
MNGLSQKRYLELPLPTEDDPRSDQQRILDSLAAAGVEERVHIPVHILRKLYPLLDNAKWKITVSLAWNGENWEMVEIEEGDTTAQHYGLAVDLGSTTVVARLLDCNSGEILKEVSCFNKQIQWGTDILSRIFYCKDNREKLEEVRRATVESICECMDKLDASHSALSMVIAGNTTMIHFLLGMDAFCVFYTPHAVHADCPGFQLARDLDIPLKGYVYCYPAKSNYLGGDIISGMIDTELYKKNEISVFFDIGTNGELVIGNKEFLLCGAGAAGPALEGGVVRTGMRADVGAVDEVKIRDGNIFVHVIGKQAECFEVMHGERKNQKNITDSVQSNTEKMTNLLSEDVSDEKCKDSNGKRETPPQGICGSGIIDLIAELFLEGWIDIRGKLSPEKSPLIQERDNQLCVEYAPGLYFYQKDIDEFIRTKSAAHTMVEIMLRESGLDLNQADRFYVAGAFGKHVSKESAITIGMYPDMDRDHIINAGNSSLEGAQKLLLNRSLLTDIDQILEEMVYIQFAEVEDFLELMVAAQALPHTDYKRYPTVMEKLKERQKDIKL